VTLLERNAEPVFTLQPRFATVDFWRMSTLAEIQEAISELPGDEREALAVWLASQTLPVLDPEEERKLLRSLDQAISDVDSGKGVDLDEARKTVRSWAGK
jgi:hypothetical protein